LVLSRTKASRTWLEQIAEAGLSGDARRLELVILNAIRSLRKSEPDVSHSLGDLLGKHADTVSGIRWQPAAPPPSDTEQGMALVRLTNPEDAPAPILTPDVANAVEQFIAERKGASRLLKEGYSPPSSVLLLGAPGTGKTMLARWLSSQLGLPLVVQDLAVSISSLLGKTGFNLRRTLDYARANPCLLLLDEFDAIAKRRDDSTELGELKRIVNVLLKELEDWPSHSVLVAATNHPELLDPAINRRFQLILRLPLPGAEERAAIMLRAAGRLAEDLQPSLLRACGESLSGFSGSDIERIMQAAARRHLSRDTPISEALVSEVLSNDDDSSSRDSLGSLIRALRTSGTMTVRDIGTLVGRSPSTVQHHLKKEPSHG